MSAGPFKYAVLRPSMKGNAEEDLSRPSDITEVRWFNEEQDAMYYARRVVEEKGGRVSVFVRRLDILPCTDVKPVVE